MNITAVHKGEEVIVEADGDPIGRLDRGFYDDWVSRIDADPESCLAACLDGDAQDITDTHPGP